MKDSKPSMSTAEISTLFEALFEDVVDLIVAYDFAHSLRSRIFELIKVKSRLNDQILNSVTIKHAFVTFYITSGRLMERNDAVYSLPYAIDRLASHTPSDNYLLELENAADMPPSPDGKHYSTRERWDLTVDIAKQKLQKLEEDYKPIQLSRHNYYAHKGRKAYDRKTNFYPSAPEAKQFVDDLLSLFNTTSGLLANTSYSFDKNLGRQAASQLLWLQMNRDIDSGAGLLAQKDPKISRDTLYDFVLNYYKRHDPINHEFHKSALDADSAQRQRTSREDERL